MHGAEVLSLWKKFAKVNVEVSLEDIDKRAEYIRHPMAWKKSEANFATFSSFVKSGDRGT